MAKSIEISVENRSELGSRANKRLRDAGLVPGVIYGHKEAVVPIKLAVKELTRHLDHGAHVFDISLAGKTEKVLVKDVQYCHLGKDVLHIDFARVSADEKVTVTVALELKGTPKGLSVGGVLTQLLPDLEIETLVTEIPDMIRVNVDHLELNSILHVHELKLPAGVKAVTNADTIVATVREPLVHSDTTAAEATAEPEVIGRKKEDEAPAEDKK
jgi:large subunit ribosomal protein L25